MIIFRNIQRFLLVVALLSAVAASLHAQDCASIHIYRPNVLSNAFVGLELYINNVKMGVVKNNEMLTVQVQSEGSYTISAKWGIRGDAYRERSEKTIELSCGTDGWVRVKSGALEAQNLLVPIHYGEAESEVAAIPENNREVISLNGSPVKKSPAIAQTQPQQRAVENTSAAPPQSPPPAQSTTSNSAGMDRSNGISYALIIGVNDYQDYSINDLDQPVMDATRLYNVLLSKYTFNKENITFLKNPTRDQITGSLEQLYGRLTEQDNLLIFYAGHGYWDEKFQQGYWLAADATRQNRGTWLSNGTIRDYVRAIHTRHTLLITDACFSGGIFKSRAAFSNSSTAINQLYKLPSRKAMTSGAMTEVPDKSVFIEYLVKRLEQNTEPYLSSEQLFASFKIAVINNSANSQVPQFGEIRETGDEGGDFIFIRR